MSLANEHKCTEHSVSIRSTLANRHMWPTTRSALNTRYTFRFGPNANQLPAGTVIPIGDESRYICW